MVLGNHGYPGYGKPAAGARPIIRFLSLVVLAKSSPPGFGVPASNEAAECS